MSTINDFNESLQIVLKKMCEMVGADYKKIDFKETNWFYEYTWTEDEADKFKKWMIDELYNSSKMRREIMNFPRKNKKNIKKVVDWFYFNYGWKCEYNEKEK